MQFYYRWCLVSACACICHFSGFKFSHLYIAKDSITCNFALKNAHLHTIDKTIDGRQTKWNYQGVNWLVNMSAPRIFPCAIAGVMRLVCQWEKLCFTLSCICYTVQVAPYNFRHLFIEQWRNLVNLQLHNPFGALIIRLAFYFDAFRTVWVLQTHPKCIKFIIYWALCPVRPLFKAHSWEMIYVRNM